MRNIMKELTWQWVRFLSGETDKHPPTIDQYESSRIARDTILGVAQGRLSRAEVIKRLKEGKVI